MISSAYRLLLRPLLFRLPPETAHKLAMLALKRRLAWRALAPALRVRDDRLKVEFCGLRMRNPIGIAAGFDKDCDMLPSLSSLGFGYLVVGTVTEDPRPGNPRPRLIRYVAEESLINSLGFPAKASPTPRGSSSGRVHASTARPWWSACRERRWTRSFVVTTTWSL